MTLLFDWDSLPHEPLPAGQDPRTQPPFGPPCAKGHRLMLEALEQSYLYAGDLLGYLHHPATYVSRVRARARVRHAWVEAEPVVLPPRLFEFSYATPPDGSPMPARGVTLPRVATIALLTRDRPARSADEVYSSLVVIWFQDRFGDPPAETLAAIEGLDWDGLAFDWTP